MTREKLIAEIKVDAQYLKGLLVAAREALDDARQRVQAVEHALQGVLTNLRELEQFDEHYPTLTEEEAGRLIT